MVWRIETADAVFSHRLEMSCFKLASPKTFFRKQIKNDTTIEENNDNTKTTIKVTKITKDGITTVTTETNINSQTPSSIKFPQDELSPSEKSKLSKLIYFGDTDGIPEPASTAQEEKKIFGPAANANHKFKAVETDPEKSSAKNKDGIQDYEKIKSELAGAGKLFEDPEFQATDSSIFYSEARRVNVVWKRPHELVDNPRFLVDGASRFDVNQGELGNCWFLAAVASLTIHEPLFKQVVPTDNSFVENYCGVFHFRFWQYGRWLDVVVDDRLPCNKNGQLLYMHSKDKREFWSALLEKAYAKVAGSYEALIGGTTSEALQDFSGGLIEIIDLKETKVDVFKIMEDAYKQDSLMGCSLNPNPTVLEAKTNIGLVRGHAYSITSVVRAEVELPNKTGLIQLCRIRNPWGNDFEWKGPWSDGSPEWQYVSESTKAKLDVEFNNDGEFWMSAKDFQTYFEILEIVNLCPDSILPGIDLGQMQYWNGSHIEGSWTSNCSAGGCVNYIYNDPKTYSSNPQYMFHFHPPEQKKEVKDKSTILVGLMQKHKRSQRKEGIQAKAIGFSLHEINEPLESLPNPLDLKYFMLHRRYADTGDLIKQREMSGRFEISPGKTYCIVPTTFKPNEEAQFHLRVFSELPHQQLNNEPDVGHTEMDKKAEVVTKLEEIKTIDAVEELFKSIAGTEEEIGWVKLKKLLDDFLKKEYQFEGFSREVCRSLLAMVDTDFTGKLGLEEFREIWQNIIRWKSVFIMFDEDKTWSLNAFELRRALNSSGFIINNQILKAITLRYGDEYGCVSFEDFVMCAVKLKTFIDAFKSKDVNGAGEMKFTLAEWLEKTLYV